VWTGGGASHARKGQISGPQLSFIAPRLFSQQADATGAFESSASRRPYRASVRAYSLARSLSATLLARLPFCPITRTEWATQTPKGGRLADGNFRYQYFFPSGENLLCAKRGAQKTGERANLRPARPPVRGWQTVLSAKHPLIRAASTPFPLCAERGRAMKCIIWRKKTAKGQLRKRNGFLCKSPRFPLSFFLSEAFMSTFIRALGAPHLLSESAPG